MLSDNPLPPVFRPSLLAARKLQNFTLGMQPLQLTDRQALLPQMIRRFLASRRETTQICTDFCRKG
jgi:hypothetical protein